MTASGIFCGKYGMQYKSYEKPLTIVCGCDILEPQTNVFGGTR